MSYSINDSIKKMEDDKENFIIGGGMVYKQFLPIASKLYLTRVHKTFEADTFFPEIDFSEWKVSNIEECEANEKNEFAHTFQILTRK